MSGPPVGPGDVRLVALSPGTLRALAAGDAYRPTAWHAQFPTAGTVLGAGLLLEAFAHVGEPLGAGSPWAMSGIVLDGEVVGEAGFHGPPAPGRPVEVEIGYEVVPEARGRGVATRACALLLAHAWRHGADVVRADADADNPASRAVLRANGFVPTDRGDFAATRPVGGAA